MKKTLTAIGLSTVLMAGALQAEEVAKSDGTYIGVGGGATFNVASVGKGHFTDETEEYKVSSISDGDAGYIVYGGYQFNKIIAVEAAFTDYGSFSETVDRNDNTGSSNVSSDPYSFSVYADAGYSFDNGLRPFGQLGLGYMSVNGSTLADKFSLDDGVTIRFGVGFEYAPAALIGFGMRVAYVDELRMSTDYKSQENGDLDTATVTNANGMLYIGAQYKF